MAQWLKILAIKPDDLILIPSPSASSFHICHGANVHPDAYTHPHPTHTTK